MDKIGNYRIIEQYHETLVSHLYKAKHNVSNGTENDLIYIIKEYKNTISQKIADRERRISQEVETRSSKSLVIPILESILEEERRYCVLQYRNNGMFLSEMLEKLEMLKRESKISADSWIKQWAVPITQELLRSVQALHSCYTDSQDEIGYLHLDLHPANIFMESADINSHEIGKAKFIDFTSAIKIRNGNVIPDAMRQHSYTGGYSAPELLSGDEICLSRASDLFSVAAIFGRMAAGQCVTDETGIFKKELLKGEKKTLSPVLGKYIEGFLDIALDRDISYRYRDAKTMSEAVERIRKCAESIERMDYYSIFEMAYRMAVPENILLKGSYSLNLSNMFKAVELISAGQKQRNKEAVMMHRYIFMQLWRIASDPENQEKIPVNLWSQLIYCGFSSCNDTAEQEMALQLLREINKIKDRMPVQEYLSMKLRMIVSLTDLFENEMAKNMAWEVVRDLSLLKDTYRKISENNGLEGQEPFRIKDLARAYSGYAACLAFLGDSEGKALEYFEKALDEFGNDRNNRDITISQILHYAMDINNIELYDRYAPIYLGCSGTQKEILDYLTNAESHPGFAEYELYILYAFLKGCYIFYSDRLDEAFVKGIKSLLDDPRLQVADLRVHPMELIYKYIGLILFIKEGKLTDACQHAFEMSINCTEKGIIDPEERLNIMMVISYQTVWTFYSLLQDNKGKKQVYSDLLKHSQKDSAWKTLTRKVKKAGVDGMGKLLAFHYT